MEAEVILKRTVKVNFKGGEVVKSHHSRNSNSKFNFIYLFNFKLQHFDYPRIIGNYLSIHLTNPTLQGKATIELLS